MMATLPVAIEDTAVSSALSSSQIDKTETQTKAPTETSVAVAVDEVKPVQAATTTIEPVTTSSSLPQPATAPANGSKYWRRLCIS